MVLGSIMHSNCVNGYCDKSLIVTVLGYIEKFENDQAESDDWVVTKVMNNQQV